MSSSRQLQQHSSRHGGGLRKITVVLATILITSSLISIDGAFVSTHGTPGVVSSDSTTRQNRIATFLTQNNRHRKSKLFAADKSKGFSSKTSESSNKDKEASTNFEYQELKVQLQAMKDQGIRSRNLMIEKKLELTGYVKKIIAQRPSMLPLGQIGSVLPNTKWTLVFSTDGATMGDLPSDATIQLDFIDETKMDYALQFSEKTLGLNRLVAKSTWTVDPGPVNPGLLTFVYDQITTDVFGLSNLPVGLFGLLKGRANYVESSFFDGSLWIERGYSPQGQEYFNVYTREK